MRRDDDGAAWDARYVTATSLFGTEPNRFLTSARPLIAEGARILAVADGEGRNGVWLAEQGFRVDSFDPSIVAVERARQLARERGVELRADVADVDGYPWPEAAYDVVVAIFVQFAKVPLRRRLFDRCLAALRPGGLFLLEGYRLEQVAYGTGGPRALDQLYSEEQLREELAGFVIEQIEGYDTVVEEGPAHSGMSSLIDVVARRPV